MPDVYISIPNPKVQEGSSFTATAYFRENGTATAPTTAKYRIDDLTNDTVVTDWTPLTPAASIEITITATENGISSDCRFEKKQLTVASDPDTSTQKRNIAVWKVNNIRGF